MDLNPFILAHSKKIGGFLKALAEVCRQKILPRFFNMNTANRNTEEQI